MSLAAPPAANRLEVASSQAEAPLWAAGGRLGVLSPRRYWLAMLCWLLAGLFLDIGNAYAHPAYLTAAQVTVDPDGRFHVAFRFDTLAFALNDSSARIGNEPMETLLTGPREELAATLTKAGARLGRGFKLITDAGEGTVDAVDFPDSMQVLAWQEENRSALPVVIPAHLDGHLPTSARTVACRFPSVLEQVILTLERPGEEAEAEAVEPGRISTTWPLRLIVPAQVKAGAATPNVHSLAKSAMAAGSSEFFQNNHWSIFAMLAIAIFFVGIWLGRILKAKSSADQSSNAFHLD